MTIDADFGTIPQFTMGDRLRKARELTDLDREQFAAELGVSRQTVGNAELDRVKPRKIMLRAWALRTGVPLVWLETGEAPRPSDEGPRVVRHQGLEPRTRWFGGSAGQGDTVTFLTSVLDDEAAAA